MFPLQPTFPLVISGTLVCFLTKLYPGFLQKSSDPYSLHSAFLQWNSRSSCVSSRDSITAFPCAYISSPTLRTVSKNTWTRDRKQSHWAVKISKSTKASSHARLVIKFTGWLLRMWLRGLEKKAEKGAPLEGFEGVDNVYSPLPAVTVTGVVLSNPSRWPRFGGEHPVRATVHKYRKAGLFGDSWRYRTNALQALAENREPLART